MNKLYILFLLIMLLGIFLFLSFIIFSSYFGSIGCTYAISKILSLVIKQMNKFSSGHAVGMLGLFLVFLGVIGEFYQIITINKILYASILFLFLLSTVVLISIFSKREK